MGNTKKDYKRRAILKKEKPVMLRIPSSSMPKIKELMEKYNIKGIQDLFDILIVSGVVFKKPEILDFIRQHRQKYFEIFKQVSLSKIGRAPKLDKQENYEVNMFMYTQDFLSFKNYTIEENIKQQWVFNILFVDGFANEEKCVIDLIERSKQLDISNRKKAITRLLDDEYVLVLPLDVANKVLEQLTDEYNIGKFDDSLEAEIESRLKLKEEMKKDKDEDEDDLEFTRKIASMKIQRSRIINQISEPRLDLDEN